MAKSIGDQRAFIRCTNCGEIMTGAVTEDGSLYPIGLGEDGKCGEAEFEVISALEADLD